MITHPEKVLFPDDGITKGELAAYYAAIAPVMLPHIVRRPVTMERYHRGIAEKGFFQKSVTKGFPEWLQRVEVPKHGGTVHHPLVTDTRSLLWMANQNCITPHVWTSRVPALDKPDLCVFDLDPADDEPGRLRATVLGLRNFLLELGLTSLVKTSGSKGFHVVVPLDGKTDVGEVAHFGHIVGVLLVITWYAVVAAFVALRLVPLAEASSRITPPWAGVLLALLLVAIWMLANRLRPELEAAVPARRPARRGGRASQG